MTGLTLPQGLAAIFFFAVSIGFIWFFASRYDAIVRNDVRTAQPDTWKIRGICSRYVCASESLFWLAVVAGLALAGVMYWEMFVGIWSAIW